MFQFYSGQRHAIETLKVYGVGACGPRGFYGTVGMSDFYLEILQEIIFIIIAHDLFILHNVLENSPHRVDGFGLLDFQTFYPYYKFRTILYSA